ncbi:MAG TPA: BON domain-containing protein [Candidatus Paenalcaligenes intestinipullorum]|uniref:BON domain-containing protein n=1 Tax=Candidatus Paenalcaligenes intestinipullorum TaxID=2838718 RepID=A0A9D2RGX0_9BURK|nr:BON domain-containing protein [Candidatus Paenalcaligenes intestinipullorum]
MKVTRNLALALMLGLTVGVTAGCSVARDQETVGEYVDGAGVTADVKSRLAKDAVTSAANIHVKTIDGGIVQLSGFAKSEREKNRAGEIARSVKGVTKVHNDLVVRP